MLSSILIILSFLFLINTYAESVEIPHWLKDNAEKITIQTNPTQKDMILLLKDLLNTGLVTNISHDDSQIYEIPLRGQTVFVNLSGNVNEYGKSGFVLLEIYKPDGTKQIIRTPLLETGFYTTPFEINDQSQRGTYQVKSYFNDKNISTQFFSLSNANNLSEKTPTSFSVILNWWIENKITDIAFIQAIQYLIDTDLIVVKNQHMPELHVSVDGQHLVRRGTTHTITSHVIFNDQLVEGARVTITIEDYGKNIIREFKGFSDNNGMFVFSWEVPQKFNDLETLLGYISVTYDNYSVTNMFKFQVYCVPGEPNCEIEGN